MYWFHPLSLSILDIASLPAKMKLELMNSRGPISKELKHPEKARKVLFTQQWLRLQFFCVCLLCLFGSLVLASFFMGKEAISSIYYEISGFHQERERSCQSSIFLRAVDVKRHDKFHHISLLKHN